MNYQPSNFLEGVDLDGRTKAVRETIKRITANRDKKAKKRQLLAKKMRNISTNEKY